MIHERRLILPKTFFFYPLLIFIASQIISTILSINPHTSLYGYYSRFNGGLFSLLSYGVIALATIANFTKKDAKTIITTILIAGILGALYAFPEHFGASPSCAIISGKFSADCWVQDVQTRVFGTFGQPNWLAAYIITIIFIPLAKIFEIRNKKYEIRSYLLFLISYLLLFLVLLFTKSRSGMLGFGIGLTVFSILSYKNNVKILLASYFLLLTSFLIFGRGLSGTTDKIFTLISPPSANYQPSPTPSTPVNSLELNITPSSDIRRIVWKGALELAKTYPLFGSGVETFAYSYYNVRPVEHNLVSEWDFLYNKAHNEFLNFAATTGFVGLGTYLIFLGSFTLWSIKKIKEVGRKKQEAGKADPILTSLLSGFIALSVSNFFGFSTVPVQILLFLFPALAHLLISPKETSPAPSHSKNGSLTTAFIFLTSIAILVLLYRISVGYQADRIFVTGKSAKENKKYPQAVEQLQKAIKLVPAQPLYTDELSITASEVAANLSQGGKTAEASEAAQIAVGLSNKTLTLNPVHLNFHKTRARMFVNLAKVDPGYAIEAAASLDQAIRLAPTDAKLWFNRALLTKQLGFLEESLNIFKQAISLKPNYEAAHLEYAKALEAADKPKEAANIYQTILTTINPKNPLAIDSLNRLATSSANVTIQP
jgi:O-antigen ligase/Flp pilus assembly protein TadD